MNWTYSEKQKEFQKRLDAIALKMSHPFCYHCDKRAPSGVCKSCLSDDLMRELPGVGVDYSTDWIIKHILETSKLSPINVEESTMQMVEDCYGETVKIGWIKYSIPEAIKALDPLSWKIALQENLDAELDDGRAISFDGGSTAYWDHEIENLIEELENTYKIEKETA